MHSQQITVKLQELPTNRKHLSRASNIAFLLERAQMLDLDFGLIQQNISNKKASFQY